MSAVIALLVMLSWELWVSRDGLRQVFRLGDAVEAQRAENETLRARNALLRAEVIDLHKGLDAIEEYARQDLGMTRPNETFFQVVQQRPARDTTRRR